MFPYFPIFVLYVSNLFRYFLIFCAMFLRLDPRILESPCVSGIRKRLTQLDTKQKVNESTTTIKPVTLTKTLHNLYRELISNSVRNELSWK